MNYTELQEQAYLFLIQAQYEKATDYYQQCIELSPEDKVNYWYLGLTFLLQDKQADEIWLPVLLQGTIEETDFWMQELIELLKLEAKKHENLGYLEESEKIYYYLLEQNVKTVEVYHDLGNVLAKQGKLEQVINYYNQLLQLDRNHSQTYINCALILLELGEDILAYQSAYKAVLIEPNNLNHRIVFASTLKNILFHLEDLQVIEEIKKCFETFGIKKNLLVGVTISILKLDKNFQDTLELAQENRVDELTIKFKQGALLSASNKQLFEYLLRDTIIPNLELEILLTNLRKIIALELLNDSYLDLNLVTSLACQCFNTEYIFAESKEEIKIIESLKLDLETILEKAEKDFFYNELENKLAVFSLYYPIYHLKNSDKLLQINDETWTKAMRLVIKRTLKNYKQEQNIKKEITSLTFIKNPVSLAVKSQYEENPYPRWLSISLLPTKPLGQEVKKVFPYFQCDREFINKNFQVLVAGCGTGQDAILIAVRYQNIQEILAIDLSLSSLAYATRMAQELQINKITFKQADILSLGSLDRQFSFIWSTGVIHHLENPLEGLKILANLLAKGGLIQLALYSKKARQSLQEARQFIQEQGFQSTEKDIKDCRQLLMRSSSELARELTQTDDFYTLSNCRDLLFHVNEHCLTLPEIKTYLEEVGLQFIGLDRLSYAVKSDYKKMFPEDQNMNDLLLWDKFEDLYPKTFAGMYIFWCQKLS